MRKLIYLITLIMILSLIGCSGVIGQSTASREDALNGMSKELRTEFNELMMLGKLLSEKEEMLLKQLGEVLNRGNELDRLNQEMAANSQNEIDDLKKINSGLTEELDEYLQQLESLRNDLNLSMVKLSDLENNNSKLNEDIQMLITADTDLINQLIQKEDEITILKDQLEQKIEDSIQENVDSS